MEDIERAGLVAAVDQAADGIVITDIEGKIRYANPALTAMTGYSREEIIGHFENMFRSERDDPGLHEEIWSTIRSGRVWQGEVVRKRKNGVSYHEEMRVSPVRDEHGEVATYMAIRRDVTERRTSQEAQRFLGAIVENTEDAIIACTPHGVLRFLRGSSLPAWAAGQIDRTRNGCQFQRPREPPEGVDRRRAAPVRPAEYRHSSRQ